MHTHVKYAAAAALAVASSQAFANPPQRHWYALDFKSEQCRSGTQFFPAAPTPELMRQFLRDHGATEDTEVHRDHDGSIMFVTISFTSAADPQPISIYWFPSERLCETGKVAAIASGMMPNPADLK